MLPTIPKSLIGVRCLTQDLELQSLLKRRQEEKEKRERDQNDFDRLQEEIAKLKYAKAEPADQRELEQRFPHLFGAPLNTIGEPTGDTTGATTTNDNMPRAEREICQRQFADRNLSRLTKIAEPSKSPISDVALEKWKRLFGLR